MKQVSVIDDFLSTKEQDNLENLLTDMEFPWYYYMRANYRWNPHINSNSIDTFQFTHVFINKKGEKNSAFNHILDPLLNKLNANFNIKSDDIFRLKSNMTFYDKAVDGIIIDPHVDNTYMQEQYYIGLYYVNDSDGDTHIFNETEKSEKYTTKLVVSPKKGRLVIFDGRLYHSGQNPSTSNPRIVINMNFTRSNNV